MGWREDIFSRVHGALEEISEEEWDPNDLLDFAGYETGEDPEKIEYAKDLIRGYLGKRVKFHDGKNKNPKRRSTFKPPFTVYTHFERGEGSISVDDAHGREVASWDTEGIEEMVESGYFDTSGFIMGREVRSGRLEQSVLDYLKDMGVITKAELL